MQEGYLTTPQVAEMLGVTVRRVQALIKAGRLPSTQYGREHVIRKADVTLVTVRKNGRPPGSKKKVSANGGTNEHT